MRMVRERYAGGIPRRFEGNMRSEPQMRIDQLFSKGKQPISFEIFPPKGDLSLDSARAVAVRVVEKFFASASSHL